MRYDTLIMQALQDLGNASTSEIADHIRKTTGEAISNPCSINHALRTLERHRMVVCTGERHRKGACPAMVWRLTA